MTNFRVQFVVVLLTLIAGCGKAPLQLEFIPEGRWVEVPIPAAWRVGGKHDPDAVAAFYRRQPGSLLFEAGAVTIVLDGETQRRTFIAEPSNRAPGENYPTIALAFRGDPEEVAFCKLKDGLMEFIVFQKDGEQFTSTGRTDTFGRFRHGGAFARQNVVGASPEK